MSSAPHSAAVAIGENPRLQAAEMESLFEGYANERVILWVPVRSFGA